VAQHAFGSVAVEGSLRGVRALAVWQRRFRTRGLRNRELRESKLMDGGEKVCPNCGKKYPSSELYCILDGSLLVDAEDSLLESAQDTSRPRLPKETLVGIALVAGIFLTILIVILFRESSQFRLHVVFDKGQNIQPGDNVFVQGHKAGSVESTTFHGDTFVATITIRPDARPYLRSNSIFYVGFDQLLTNKRCIVVATSDASAPPLENGQRVQGHSFWGRIPEWAKQQIEKYGGRIVAQ
jgi:hypothetical protein